MRSHMLYKNVLKSGDCMTTKISLCIIAKNEEKNIKRCLQSAVGVVDEMIVIDTGSCDKTSQIAQTFGAKVQSFIWNDNFSDARNASLDLATGDWILFLDADEELTKESGIILRRAAENGEVEGYFNKIINFTGNEACPETSADIVFRLFRNKPEYRFRNAIHEQICDVISEQSNQANYQFLEDVVILHYGYLDSQLKEKDKKRRNLILLEKELIKRPTDSLVRFHYAVELYRMGENLSAAKEFEKVLVEINLQEVIYGAKLMRYIVLAYYGANEWTSALRAVKEGLSLYPDYADLYYYGGVIYYQLRDYGLAYEYFKKAVQTPTQLVHYASFYGLQGFRSCYYLGQIAEKFCNEEKALGYYIDCLRDNCNFTAAIDSIIPILEPRSDPDYAHYALGKICDLSSPQANLLIGDLLFKHSAYTAALAYFEEVPNGMLTSQLVLYKAICLIQQRRSLEALHLLESIDVEDTLSLYAKLNKLLCFWFEGNRQKVRALGDELLAIGLSEDTVAVIELLRNTHNKKKTSKFIGSEGIILLLEILKRALDLGEIELCKLVLARVSSESLREHYLSLGELFYQYGHFSQAEEYLRQHIQKDSENALAYFLLAELKAGQELYFDAIDYYQKALLSDPTEPKYYIKLIKLYEKVRSELLKNAAEKYPEFPIFGTLLEEAVLKNDTDDKSGHDSTR